MAGKFNLAEVLANVEREKGVACAPENVSNLDTGREQIRYIDMAQLDDDPNNFYELSNLDELAANIELLGLQQPIRVRPGEAPGRYIIVSGHRRRAAMRQLVEEGREDLRELPCIVERSAGSAALQELRLIYANSDTRKLSSADLSRQAERVEALLYQLKEEGYEFPGRMRDHVAEACKVSKSKLARLKVIRENLDARWKPAYERGKLAESAAYALAQMPPERQRVIYDGLKKNGKYPNSVYEGTVSSYGKSLAQVENIQCKTYAHGPCVNREAMQQRVMSKDAWSYNNCSQCCGECGELAKCKCACPLLADKIKQLKADAKAQREQNKQAQEEEVRPQVEAIQRIWKRFGEARAAAGKSVEECYQAANVHYTEADGQKHEKLERLEEKCTTTTDLPCGFAYYLTPFRAYARLADLLGVSLDYLLCRTVEPAGFATQPEGQLVICGWMPGGTLPHQPCDVVADFALDGDTEIRMTCNFDGRAFRHQSGGAAIDFEPVRWMVLPPVEEDQKSRPEAGAAGQD